MTPEQAEHVADAHVVPDDDRPTTDQPEDNAETITVPGAYLGSLINGAKIFGQVLGGVRAEISGSAHAGRAIRSDVGRAVHTLLHQDTAPDEVAILLRVAADMTLAAFPEQAEIPVDGVKTGWAEITPQGIRLHDEESLRAQGLEDSAVEILLLAGRLLVAALKDDRDDLVEVTMSAINEMECHVAGARVVGALWTLGTTFWVMMRVTAGVAGHVGASPAGEAPPTNPRGVPTPNTPGSCPHGVISAAVCSVCSPDDPR